jgi:hypothetical protein
VGYPSMPEGKAGLQPATPPDAITLPAPQLTLPAAPEKQFPIRHREWLQLRRKIACLSDPLPNWANIGWVCVGIAATTVPGFLSWIATSSQLPTKFRGHYEYVSWVLASVAVTSIAGAVYSFFVNKKMSKMKATSVANVLADMDEIYAPYTIRDADKAVIPNLSRSGTLAEGMARTARWHPRGIPRGPRP